jgi:hypothetical protein
METSVKKTWKPVFAGILDIISTFINLWFLLALSLEGTVFQAVFPKSICGLNNPLIVYLLITLPLVCISILTLIGGIYALKRKKWKLALAGSIAAIFSWIPVLILATAVVFGSTPICILGVILLVESKDEFE